MKLSKKLYETGIYGVFSKILGVERGIDNFLKETDFDCQNDIKILEVGCGNGAIGLHLLKRFPKSTLLATDIEENSLKELIKNFKKQGVDNNRISVGLSDITTPDEFKSLNNSVSHLNPQSFDVVCAGGVIGYSKNQPETIKKLLNLIKPGGYFIDIEMNDKFLGKFIGSQYNYPIMPLKKIKKLIENEGYKVSIIPFSERHFPANLSRCGIIARKI
ncbi:MAG: class I SAM-dependent methyltransferase [Candidatus Pacebacteria bacterium]|nr:class I SAM-dependent methyltransferase [Candidatus Paceibacterota bacterium]